MNLRVGWPSLGPAAWRPRQWHRAPPVTRRTGEGAVSFLLVLPLYIHQGYSGSGGDPGNSYLVGIACFHFDFHGLVTVSPGQIHNGLSSAREERLSGYTDGLGNAADHRVHAAIHSGTQARVRVQNAGGSPETAGVRVFAIADLGQGRNLVDLGLQGQFRERIDANDHVLVGGDAAAIGFFDLALQFQGVQVGYLAQIHARKDVVTDLIGFDIAHAHGARIVHVKAEKAGDGRL